jgi:hypothetical protein
MASEIKVDTISEKTSANGVTIDGVNIKDSALATAGSVPLSTIDIDGGTDIGAAIVDADLFIVDDGAGGTNRKVTASRIKTYAGVSGDVTTIDSLLNTDIKIGEDDQTKIDFETADEIHFYAANVEQVYLGDNIFGPQSDNDVDLGASGVEWKDAYFDGTVTADAGLFDTLGVITAKDLGVGIHIRTADSGASVGGNADELVIEGSGHSGMSILSGTSSDGSIFFGDSGDNDHGIIRYEHDNARLSFTANATENFFVSDGGCNVPDDKGIQFGTGPDYYLGAVAGEASVELNGGSTQGAGTNEGLINFTVTPTDGAAAIKVQGGESDDASLYLYADQAEGGGASWGFLAKGAADKAGQFFIDNDLNTSGQNFQMNYAGNADADSTWDDNTWDYAELFPWKTELSNDSDINALWGKTVVLDGDFVRIAEAGEEALVMGVVRPKGSTSSHGDGLKWKGKYGIDVWGNYEYEDYTHVYWQEFLPNGNVAYRHSYPKNEIPSFRLKDGIGRDLNNHTKEENFTLNRNSEKTPVVVPQTEEEKTATNYKEKTLNRRKFSSDYNPDLPYIRRKDRPKEWVLIGMLGQVPIRDTAIIPTHWKKMKDLESGIDKYFIFNK